MNTFYAYRGDTWTVVLTISDAGVDLSTASAKLTVRDIVGGTQIVQVTSPTQILMANPAANKLTATVPLAGVAPGEYVFDIQVTLANGNVHTFPRPGLGRLIVHGDVTT